MGKARGGIQTKVARWQNLIPSFPALHPGAIQGKEGIKFCNLATLVCIPPLALPIPYQNHQDSFFSVEREALFLQLVHSEEKLFNEVRLELGMWTGLVGFCVILL